MKCGGLKSFVGMTILVVGLPLPAWSLGKVTWGAEFTFFNPQTNDRTGTNRTVKRMRQHLTVNQEARFRFKEDWFLKEADKEMDFDSVPSGPGKSIGKNVSPDEATSLSIGRFTSPFGWWFEWGLDDKVMEIKTMMELEEYEENEQAMQDAIFASANLEGLYAPAFLGGGHINLGMTAFKGNDLLFRNFVVDLFNHNELFLGVFNYDTHNGVSLSVQTERVKRAVAQVIKDFDGGAYTGKNAQERFAADLQDALDLEVDMFFEKWGTDDGMENRHNYFAVNFSHVVAGKPYSRVELKGVRAQWSMNQWIRQIRLLTKRLRMLETIKKPILLKFRIPVEKLNLKKHLLQPPVNPEDALRSFYMYVTESGEAWADHTDYLWLKWHSDGEVERFQRSAWFKFNENKMVKSIRRTCETRLR